MFGVDKWLESLLNGPPTLWLVLLVSFALGLRHAADPDHLTAVTTLIATEERGRAGRRAALLGLSWGLGHAITLVALGLPMIFLNRFLPEPVQRAAEVLIGIVISFLALRLLLRWRRGLYHAHVHTHADTNPHVHLHSHASDNLHRHQHLARGRSPLTAFGIGTVHGIGGSAGVTLLLLATITPSTSAVVSLLIFAIGTALSMAIISTGFGLVITGGPVARRFNQAVPVLGVLSLAFGVYYILGALGLVAYTF